MDLISKLADIDPVFAEVAKALYPEVDPRELWDLSKSMPDQSASHVNRNEKRKKIALAGGLAFGAGAEALAAKDTIGPVRAALKATKGLPGATRVGRLVRPGGKALYQGANFGIGLLAARELVKKPKKHDFSKALEEACAPVVEARLAGTITTEQALVLIDDIEKGFSSAMARTPVIGHAIKHFKSGEDLTSYLHRGEGYVQGTYKAARKGRMIIGGAAAGAAAGIGSNKGAKKQQKKIESAVMGKSVSSKYGKLSAIAGTAGQKNPDMPASVKASVPTPTITPPKPKITAPMSKGIDYGFEGQISKVDEDKRQVFGWANLATVDGAEVVDLQNDHVSIDEMEKAAYDYVKSSRKGGDMHTRIGDEPLHTSDMIESMIVTPEKLSQMGVPASAIAKMNTGWWVGFQVNDDKQWDLVKKGLRTGFSIHGTGTRVERV